MPNGSTDGAMSRSNIHLSTEKNILSGNTASSNPCLVVEPQSTLNNIPQYPVSVDIPMQEVRRQNEVEHWRNKVRLQQKFEVISKFYFNIQFNSIKSFSFSNIMVIL